MTATNWVTLPRLTDRPAVWTKARPLNADSGLIPWWKTLARLALERFKPKLVVFVHSVRHEQLAESGEPAVLRFLGQDMAAFR
jgi:exoribonuclease II